jgi:uncharacterized membrane protein (DUF373 family)
MEEIQSTQDPLILKLKTIICLAVRLLAVLMTLVILWGVLDVGWVLYRHLMEPPFMMLTISDILDTFGAFMAVLIAIEIFVNITVYLQDDVIHVKIVMATALMAIARKVIILDFTKITSDYIWSTAALVTAMSIGYWLVIDSPPQKISRGVQALRQPAAAHGEAGAEPGSDAAVPAAETSREGRKPDREQSR